MGFYFVGCFVSGFVVLLVDLLVFAWWGCCYSMFYRCVVLFVCGLWIRLCGWLLPLGFQMRFLVLFHVAMFLVALDFIFVVCVFCFVTGWVCLGGVVLFCFVSAFLLCGCWGWFVVLCVLLSVDASFV